VQRFDFILGVQATAPHNCGILSFGDTLYINIIRNITESEFEYRFLRVLQEMGLPVLVESNGEPAEKEQVGIVLIVVSGWEMRRRDVLCVRLSCFTRR